MKLTGRKFKGGGGGGLIGIKESLTHRIKIQEQFAAGGAPTR